MTAPFDFGCAVGSLKTASTALSTLGAAVFKPPVAKTAAASTALARTAQPLVGELVRRAPVVAKAVGGGGGRAAGAAAGAAAGNLSKYLTAGGIGLGVGGAAGYAAGKKAPAQKSANAAAIGSHLAGNIPGIAGGLHGAYTAPSGSKFEGAFRGAMRAPSQVTGGLLGAGLGAVHGLTAMPSRAILNVGKGMDTGANAGTRAMDTLLGGRATGLGGRILRAPAQAFGAGLGAVGGLVTSPLAAIGGALSDTAVGAARGARIGGQVQDSLMGGPAAWQRPAAKQAGIADTAQAALDKSKKVVGVANNAAKGVANKAVDMGSKAQQGFDKWRKTKSC